MACEVLSVLIKTVLGINIFHSRSLRVDAFPSSWVFYVVLQNKKKERSKSSFLKDSHQTGGESFLVIRRNLVDASTAENIASFNLLEFQVTRYFSMNQQLDKTTICHQKLGNQVDIPVPTITEAVARAFGFFKSLEQLIKRMHGSAFSTVVRVAIHMKNLFPVYGQQTTQNTFLESCTKDNIIVFLIHD